VWDNLSILDPSVLPLEPYQFGRFINKKIFFPKILDQLDSFLSKHGQKYVIGIGKPSALAEYLLAALRPVASFYDAMDNFPAFHKGMSRRYMALCEEEIAATVDKVWCSATAIKNKLSLYAKDIDVVMNAYNMDSLPSVIKPQKLRKQITYGYIGALSNWFDWHELLRLAESDKDCKIMLVGPCHTITPKLPDNVELYPPCKQSDVINYLTKFDIGLIPFKKNELTDSVDPIKYYEYMGYGLPVLSTKFGTMREHVENGGILFFEDYPDLSGIGQLFNNSIDEQKTIDFRKKNSWSCRFGSVSDWFNSI
jgi:glycosyltransferase involved in cell wall biosynthesis